MTESLFRQGADEAEKASARKGGSFHKIPFFKLDDKESAVLRFLTEVSDWIVVDQHQQVPTKPAPEGFTGNWPQHMGAVCRLTELRKGNTIHPDCYICANLKSKDKNNNPIPFKKGVRVWAMACLREPVTDEGGKLIGYRDATRTFDRKKKDSEETEPVTEKALVYVNMAQQNFFSLLQAQANFRETILDRDYHITRKGEMLDTTYAIVGLDPQPASEKRGGGMYDLRRPELLDLYTPEPFGDNERKTIHEILVEEVLNRASDEFYARFFDRTKTVTDSKTGGETVTEAAPAAPTSDVDDDELAALAARVKNHPAPGIEGTPSATTEPEPTPAPATSGAVELD